MSKVNFVVVEPSFLLRKGVVSLINELPNATVVREVESEQRLPELVSHFAAHVLVINTTLLQRIKPDDMKKLGTRRRELSLVALAHSDATLGNSFGSILAATIQVHEPKASVVKKFKQLVSQMAASSDGASDSNDLSDREVEILKDVALGLSNKEIAEKNFISPHTVITHRKNITRKLGIKTVAGLTIYAIINKLIGMDEVS